jgi:hypothetical protein
MHTLTMSRRRWPFLGLMAGLIVIGAGCDSENGTPVGTDDDATTQTEDVNSPLGGYTSSDEMAGFGEAYLLGEEGEAIVADPLADDPTVIAALDDPATDIYAVRVLWGHIRRHADVSAEPVDWTGGASIDDPGMLLIRRTVSFEARQGDHVVFPRPDAQSIEWVSTTYGGADGIHIVVINPADTPNSFRLAMPLLPDWSVDVSALDGLNEVVSVDDQGHEVRIAARKIVLDPICREGFLSGAWRPLGDSADIFEGPIPEEGAITGRILGHWAHHMGPFAGYLRGFYGVDAEDHLVFFAKMTDRRGQFAGFLRGIWDTDPGTDTSGEFVGQWLDRGQEMIGAVRGTWDATPGEDNGFFIGEWTLGCDFPPTGGGGGEELQLDPSIFE